MESELTQEIVNLRPGDHLCLFYEREPGEQMPALIPFIQDALSGDEQFVYVADDQTVEELEARLQQNGVNVSKERERGALKLWTRREWRQPGELSSEAKLGQVLQYIQQACQSGFKGSRFAIEMTWTLGPDINVDRLEHWEATLNTIFVPGFSGRIVCQYNRSRLAPDALLAALHTHPLAILGDHVYPNWFYQAPVILNGDAKSSKARVEWMISVLKRSRAAEKEREELIVKRAALTERGRLAAIVESSDDAIISKDLNGIITTWNRGAEQIFGYRDAEIIGKPISVLIPADRHGEELAILARIRRGERIEHYETVRQRKDGRLADISLSISPIRDVDGKVIGASKIARDITRRKQMEAALEEAKDAFAKELQKRVEERTVELELANLALRKEMGEQKKLEKQLWQAQKMEIVGNLAGGVAHDFNNILNIIKGYTALLRQSLSVDENAAESLHIIDETVERGAYGVRQLLTLARKTEARLALTNANDLLSDLSKLLKQTFPKTIVIALELDPNLPSVLIDSNQISQALLNLCINARDAMPGGGKLILKTHVVEGDQIQDAAATAESYVSIEVKDSGTGMDAAIQNRIFEPFFTTKGIGEGTGLGLAIVYSIVKNHKGAIDVNSEAGRGTTFRLYFPTAPSEAMPIADKLYEQKSSAPKPTNGRGNILVVEDEENMVYLLRKALLRKQCGIFVAIDGEQAIDLYHRYKQDISVVLLDIGLPKLSGWDIIVRMKEENPNVKVFVTSGYLEPDLKSRMQRAGVQGFIEKPYNPDDVVQILCSSTDTS